MGIENRFLLRTGSHWIDSLEVLNGSAINSSAVTRAQPCLFRPQPTWRLGRGVQKCGYISRKKTTTGLAKRLFRQRGGDDYHYSETFVHTA